MKYQMDEDLLPERMLDVEDDKVQNISEKSGLMYPDDNSIMRVDHFTVAGKKFSKSLIIKDNLRFGLRQRDKTKDEVKHRAVELFEFPQDEALRDPSKKYQCTLCVQGYNMASEMEQVTYHPTVVFLSGIYGGQL